MKLDRLVSGSRERERVDRVSGGMMLPARSAIVSKFARWSSPGAQSFGCRLSIARKSVVLPTGETRE
jgi:hypothetical protein